MDLKKEEIRRSTQDGSSSKEYEENLALVSKARKGKEKDSDPKLNSSHGGKKGDKYKVRCFSCHEMGHYVTNLPSKKYKKGSSEGFEGETLASQFKMDFTLIACMVCLMMGCGWFLHSGASFHMIGNKCLFSTLEEKYLKILIDMGDDEMYSVSGVGTVAFQREHGALTTLTNVKYVPGLKKNLVSIAMLEDKGYGVVFNKRKVLLRHITTGQVKQIDSQVQNLYALEVQDACKTLTSKANVKGLVVERERVNYLATCNPRRSLIQLWRSHNWRC